MQRQIEGVIEETMPRGLYRVRCKDGSAVVASLGRQASRITIQLVPGDRVDLEVFELDPTRGRILIRRR